MSNASARDLSEYCKETFGLKFSSAATLAALVAFARKEGPEAWLPLSDMRRVVERESGLGRPSVSTALRELVGLRYAQERENGAGRRFRATRAAISNMARLGTDDWVIADEAAIRADLRALLAGRPLREVVSTHPDRSGTAPSGEPRRGAA